MRWFLCLKIRLSTYQSTKIWVFESINFSIVFDQTIRRQSVRNLPSAQLHRKAAAETMLSLGQRPRFFESKLALG